ELAPAIIALMTNNGISELNVKINNDGLSLGSNGEMLADVRLGDADALGILTAFAPQASMVLPYLHLRDRIDVDLTVSLP
ncbi:MAG: hypothetical protein OXK81_04785, partial [Chloroflexota bacterium]|nr:hypothetical protein [Chloroflexota bacterium]